MTELQINTPDEHVGGTFASGVRVQYSKWAFVLDFLVHDDRVEMDGSPDVWMVVQRLRLDPSAAHQLLTVLASQLDQYNERHGDPDKPFDSGS